MGPLIKAMVGGPVASGYCQYLFMSMMCAYSWCCPWQFLPPSLRKEEGV